MVCGLCLEGTGLNPVVNPVTAYLQGLWESQRNFSRPLVSWESVYF